MTPAPEDPITHHAELAHTKCTKVAAALKVIVPDEPPVQEALDTVIAREPGPE